MFKSYDANLIKKYLIFTLNIFFYSIIFNLLCFIKTIKLIIMKQDFTALNAHMQGLKDRLEESRINYYKNLEDGKN